MRKVILNFAIAVKVILSVSQLAYGGERPASAPPIDERLTGIESRVNGHDTEIAELSRKIDALKLAIRCPCPRGGACICGEDCVCPNCPKHSKAKQTATTGQWKGTTPTNKGVELLFFGASWCTACPAAEARLGSAKSEIFYIDCTDSNPIAQRYGINGFPYLLKIQDGRFDEGRAGDAVHEVAVRDWLSGRTLTAGAGANTVGGKPSAPAATSLPPDAQPTPWNEVQEGLKLLNPKPSEVLADFGCGHDARLLIHAARYHDVKKSVGVEIDKDRADSARRHVSSADLEDRITILDGDATKTEVNANVGMAYLWPDTLAELRPKIEKMDRFASYAHSVPGLKMTKRGNWYLWEKKTPVEFSPVVRKPQRSQPVYYTSVSQPVYYNTPSRSQPVYYNSGASWGNYNSGASWGGRSYSAPVCNSPGCSMCNSIRSQLGWR